MQRTPNRQNLRPWFREELDKILVGYLRRLVPFLLLLFLFMEGAGYWIWPTSAASGLFVTDTAAVLVLGVLLILLHRGRIAGRSARTALVVVALAALMKNTAAIFWLQDPLLTFNTMLILLITAMLSVSWIPYLFVWICVVATWGLVAGPIAPLAENLALWSAFNITGFLGALILNSRLALFEREFEARFNQQRQSDQLAEALGAAEAEITERQKAERILAEALHFDRSLNRLALSTRGILEPRPLLEGVIREAQHMMGADRAWLLSPCDSRSETFRLVALDDSSGPGSFIDTTIPAARIDRERLEKMEGQQEVQVVHDSQPLTSSEENLTRATVTAVISTLRPSVGPGWLIGIEFSDPRKNLSPMAMAAFEQICAYTSSALNSAMLHAHLVEVQARLRNVFTNLEEGLYELDTDGRITMVSPSIERFFGLPEAELLGNRLYHHLKSDVLQVLTQAYQKVRETGGSERGIAVSLENAEGEVRFLEFSLSPVKDAGKTVKNFLGIIRDVTEERKQHEKRAQLEERLRQSQQLETLGTLAGGVAHDFNNLLSGIMGQAQLIAMRSKPGDANGGAAEIIERAAERGAQLTAQLLGFARQGKFQIETMDLRQSVEEIAGLLGRTIDKSIRIELEADDTPCFIQGDPGQIHGVLLNLAVNARDAMPGGGTLSFGVHKLRSSDVHAWSLETPPSGKLVCVEIRDTGPGIPEDIRDRVFEPFFTTKPQGKGSGMGLAMAHGTVIHHGGEITFDCPTSGGTVFRVFLPHTGEEQEEHRVPETPPRRIKGGETILVIDDEAAIRILLEQMLEMMGYKVLLASSGEEGVEVYRENEERISLVIVDMMMTGINGLQCFEQLKKINPEVRAVLCSGYSRESRAHEMLEAGVGGFLQKPFKYGNLAEMIDKNLTPQIDPEPQGI